MKGAARDPLTHRYREIHACEFSSFEHVRESRRSGSFWLVFDEAPSDRVTKMSYVYAFGGDLCALGGWTITIDCGGYLAIVYTFVGGTWKIRTSVFKYPTS